MNTKKLTKLVEEFICNELSLMGMDVTKLERSVKNRRPDFLVKDGFESYLVELKSKFSNYEEQQDRNERLNRGEIVEEETRLRYENALSGKIKDAASQLTSYIEEQVDYKLVWLHAQGHWTDQQYKQFEVTLYGKADIANLVTRKIIPCYYYTAGEFFYRRTEIDGAIISTNKGGKFCLNTFSRRYSALRKSMLCAKFGRAVCDPGEEEIQGKAYNISDYGGDRNCESEVLRFLQNKYKQKYLVRGSSYCYGTEVQIG
jgi:hypothetical protein